MIAMSLAIARKSEHRENREIRANRENRESRANREIWEIAAFGRWRASTPAGW